MVTQSGARLVEVPMKDMAKAIPDGRPNMIALGIAARLLGFTVEQALAPIEKRLADKGPAAIEASLAGIKVGFGAAAGIDFDLQLPAPAPSTGRRWLLSGNEATALGAIRGGVRFAAAYPITPATEILEWLAPNLTKVGGTLLQAEDELAAINMIIGASYGGTPSLTATSGPGLSLMIEALGLATSAEIPIVVVDVMRGGPSTGIPTKSEQGDLNIAIYGMHGDAPHLVLAPQSVGDCVFTTQWATYLAEALQAPAIVLSDQFIGQSRAAIERPADVAFIGARSIASEISGTYMRHAMTANGVSPMAIPGTRGANIPPTASPIPSARLRPAAPATTWPSSTSGATSSIASTTATIGRASKAAAILRSSPGVRSPAPLAKRSARATADGIGARMVAPRLLTPVQPEQMAAALEGVKRILVVEQTHGGQFNKFLRAHYDLPAPVRVFNRPGPLPITAGEIHRAIADWR